MRVIEASIPAPPFYPDLVKKRDSAELKFHERLIADAASWLDSEEKNVIRSVIESIVLRNTFKTAERRLTNADSGVTPR